MLRHLRVCLRSNASRLAVGPTSLAYPVIWSELYQERGFSLAVSIVRALVDLSGRGAGRPIGV
jgi:hypothetical protein